MSKINIKTEKEAGSDLLYLLGYPLGYTPLVYYQLVKGLNKGVFKNSGKNEFFNFDSNDLILNDYHFELRQKHENGLYNYWEDKYKNIKLRFLESMHEYNDDFYIFRDTVEPSAFSEFLSFQSEYRESKTNAIIVNVDTNYLAKSLDNKSIYFPTNASDVGESKEGLIESISQVKNNYESLSENNPSVEIVDIEDFFKRPTIVLDIANQLGYKINKNNYKNHLGRKIRKYKSKYEKNI